MDHLQYGLPASLTITTPPSSQTLKRPKSACFPEQSFTLWADRPYLYQHQSASTESVHRKWISPSQTSWLVQSIEGTSSVAQRQTTNSIPLRVETAIQISVADGQPKVNERQRSNLLVSPPSTSKSHSGNSPLKSTTDRGRLRSWVSSSIRSKSYSLGDDVNGTPDTRSRSRMSERSFRAHHGSSHSVIVNGKSQFVTAMSKPNTPDQYQSEPLTQGSSSQLNNYASYSSPRQTPHSTDEAPIFEMMDTAAISLRSELPRSEISPPSIRLSSSVQLDTDTPVEAEPESSLSPLDYSLFAEATSSLDFDLTTPTATGFQPPSFTHTQSFPIQPTPQDLEASSRHHHLVAPLQFSNPLRSRSVPPRPSPPLQVRSVSNSETRAPAYVTPSGIPSRAQVWLETLGIPDDSTRFHDDELPDYETSQREAYNARRGEATRRARELEQSWLRGRREGMGRRRRS